MLLSKLWGYLLMALAAVGGVLGFAAYFKRQGRKDEQAADTEKALQQAKDANAIDTAVRNMSDNSLDEQLRSMERKD